MRCTTGDFKPRYYQPTQKELSHLYVERGLSAEKTAKLLNAAKSTVVKRLKQMGVFRTMSQARKGRSWESIYGYELAQARKELQSRTRKGKKMSINSIIKGKNHYNWKGGRMTKRGRDWHNIRAEVLKRDGYSCIFCGCEKKLNVHHWIPYRISKNNSLSNLSTLCPKCHMIYENGGMRVKVYADSPEDMKVKLDQYFAIVEKKAQELNI